MRVPCKQASSPATIYYVLNVHMLCFLPAWLCVCAQELNLGYGGSEEVGLSFRNKVTAAVIFVAVALYRGTLPQTEKAAEVYFSSVSAYPWSHVSWDCVYWLAVVLLSTPPLPATSSQAHPVLCVPV